ncbi:NACHT domain-containing protein [Erythrobacter sp. W302b]|uniref:NACHT domain-containing protein n=1 Tax=Erythrobacter sp. W302b TaxID=3389874 RepID=UPI00396B3210
MESRSDARRVNAHLELIAEEIIETIENSIGPYERELAEADVEEVYRYIYVYISYFCSVQQILDTSRNYERFTSESIAPFLELAKSGYPKDPDTEPPLLPSSLRTGDLSKSSMVKTRLSPLGERAHQILEASLRNAAELLFEVVSTMDGFSRDRFEWQVQKLLSIYDLVKNIDESISGTRIAHEEEIKNDALLEPYLRAIFRECDTLQLLGIDAASNLKHYPLQGSYTSLSINDRASAEEVYPKPEDVLLRLIESKPGERTLLLRGDAGSGKSTICKWLILQLCLGGNKLSNTFGKRPSFPARDAAFEKAFFGKTPFLLELRDSFADTPELRDFARKCPGVRITEDWIESKLRNGDAVLFIDGLDESSPSARTKVANWLHNINDQYPETIIIVTTRPNSVPQPWNDFPTHFDLEVNALSDDQKQSLVELWFDTARLTSFNRQESWESLAQIEDNLLSEFRNVPQLKRLASNPFLCSAMCALAVQRGGTMPDDIWHLCFSLIDALIDQRDRESRLAIIAETNIGKLNYSKKRHIFRSLALEMTEKSYSRIPLNEAMARLASTAAEYRIELNDDDCHLLIERSGIVRYSTTNSLEFVHNTIREVLTADAVINSKDADYAVSKIGEPGWEDVSRYLIASGNGSFARRLIDELIRLASLDQPTSKGFAGIALSAAGRAVSLSPRQWQQIQTIVDTLLPPSDFDSAEAIVIAGPTIIDHLQYHEGMQPEIAAACVRSLSLLGTERAHEELLLYVSDSRSLVRRELIDRINPLYIPDYCDMVVQGLPIPSDVAKRITDIGPALSRDPEELNLAYANIRQIAFDDRLFNLKSLNLTKTRLLDISFVADLPILESLDISFTRVTSIAPLSGNTSIKTLWIDYCPIMDLEFLESMIGLKTVFARRVPSAIDLVLPRGVELYIDD